MVVIAKNDMPKVFKKLINRPYGYCLKAVKIDGMSMSHTSKIHGVPRITLHDKISGN